jgi:hypothetical protein
MKQNHELCRNLRLFTLSTFCAVLFAFTGSAQNKTVFTGMLEYSIAPRDTSLRAFYPNNSMFIFTNDTIVRTENYTAQLGVQVNIHHLEMNKAYLLLDNDIGKFAIASDFNSLKKDDTTQYVSKYHFRKKGGSKKVLGRKVKRMIVTHDDSQETFEFWYDKKISSKYNQVFSEMPGLPVEYSVVTADAVLDYRLVRISEYLPNRDLFGIPSDFERITFDEFIERMLQQQEIPE